MESSLNALEVNAFQAEWFVDLHRPHGQASLLYLVQPCM
ncbi:hypothetical protein B4098_1061 [Heyndrickxia coagulans]|uniref:Uncharacterized protein n=1 Tax=Heyndrickxia coagulans TaxID=1398 RepID=A0A150JVG5_HEYCO|nr:hypothetical protein B4098_1061 [Heyndrickxia coagulans]